jgi:hypothetical protein
MVLVEMFPAASVAVMTIVFVPGVRAIGADQVLVPRADPTAPVDWFTQVIEVTPTGSAAVPETVTLEFAVL